MVPGYDVLTIEGKEYRPFRSVNSIIL